MELPQTSISDSVHLKEGMTVATIKQAESITVKYCAQKGCSIKLGSRKSKYLYFRCKNEECMFRCNWNSNARKGDAPSDADWTLRKFTAHDAGCSVGWSEKRTSFTAKRVLGVASGVVQLLKKKPKDLQSDVSFTLNVEMTEAVTKNICRTKREEAYGNASAQIEHLPSYIEQHRKNGQVCKLIIDKRDTLKFAFIGFTNLLPLLHERSVIALDGTHAKSKMKGVMLFASMLDSNREIVVLACALCPSESKETWTHFATSLRELLSKAAKPLESQVFISDREKGLISALQNVFGESEHVHCVVHIGRNLGVSASVTTHLVATAKSINKPQFDARYSQLTVMLSENQKQKLEKIPLEQWVCLFGRNNRQDIVTSNTAESLNSVLRAVRSCAAIDFFEGVLSWIVTKQVSRAKTYASMPKPLVPRVMKRLGAVFALVDKGLRVIKYDDTSFQVGQYVVEGGNCSCEHPQQLGYPCMHVILAYDLKADEPSALTAFVTDW
eukprot:m.340812 g.340812  ORF g.340812 m.340812 type:complete len:497 (+) comp16107_c0_seq4:4098-5588(+)